jgi:hypothetical protein
MGWAGHVQDRKVKIKSRKLRAFKNLRAYVERIKERRLAALGILGKERLANRSLMQACFNSFRLHKETQLCTIATGLLEQQINPELK